MFSAREPSPRSVDSGRHSDLGLCMYTSESTENFVLLAKFGQIRSKRMLGPVSWFEDI